MKLPPDMSLWDYVIRSITPRGKSAPPRMPEPVLASKLFEPTLDLHGRTIERAFQDTLVHLIEAKRAGVHKCLIITGKSGEIRREFPMWISGHPLVIGYTEENGGGAFKVHVKP